MTLATAIHAASTRAADLIEAARNLAESPHFKDLDESEFREYVGKVAARDWREFQLSLYEVYVAVREEQRAEGSAT